MSSTCAVCSRCVKKNQRKLMCCLCKKFAHKCCSELTVKEFRNKDSTLFWHCSSCNSNIHLPFNHISDEREYLLELYRFFEDQTLVKYDLAHFEHLKYDPTVTENSLPADDCNCNSSYYSTDDLNKCDVINSNNLTLLNANTRSLYKNFDSLKDFLSEIDVDFNIIGIVETWFKDQPHEYFYLNGYNLETCNRKDKKGGGVCLYIDENVVYHVRNDLNGVKHPANTESLFIEVVNNKTQNIVIGNIYRPPGQNIADFNQYIDTLLNKITKHENKILYIMGDFNINLLNDDIHSPTSEFIDTLSSYSLYPSITRPTRITSTSATLIDNIFTNNFAKQTSGIILADISDHLPIFMSTDLKGFRNDDRDIDIEVRDMKEKNVSLFKEKLCNVNWDDLCSSADVNVNYTVFVNTFQTLYDECIPKKVIKKHSAKKKPKAPWITNCLLKCIRRKNSLYKKSVRNPTVANIHKYKVYRNKLNSLLRVSKQNYFSSQLEKEKRNMRNTWKVLNSILRCPKKTSCQKFVSGNKTYTNPSQIANEFNHFFANIGPSLANKIQHQGKDFSMYLNNSCASTCFFKPTDVNEIEKIIGKLGNNKSPGYDLIKSNVVKLVAHQISYPLKLIFNMSLNSGIVPDALKIAKVVPIYKKDSPETFSNYRPVSVLPCFSKILERIVHERCYNFLSVNNILYKRQYGFRHMHSTYMAVLDFIKDINSAIDNNMYTAGIFMDLSKAFDTIDHDILLCKLYHYGFRGVSYEWFKSYLINRRQFVSYNNVLSSYENVQCGVPQGSILGPLLFIIYMNDICTTSKLLSFILFADDTTVFYSNKDINNVYDTINSELKEVCNWFKCNKLSLNAKKTNLMFIGTPHQTKQIKDNRYIFLDGCKLTRVSDAKFLGITLDENLTWKSHINVISKTCSRNIGVLNKLKYVLPKPTLYQLYCTLILPYLSYGILLWGSACYVNLNRIFKLQKRAIRIISNSSYLCHTKPLFEKYNVLDIFDLYSKEVCLFMHKYHNGLLPRAFDNLFTNMKDVHDYNTRNKNNYRSEIHKMENVISIGPKMWNYLPKEIRSLKHVSAFKSKLVAFLKN